MQPIPLPSRTAEKCCIWFSEVSRNCPTVTLMALWSFLRNVLVCPGLKIHNLWIKPSPLKHIGRNSGPAGVNRTQTTPNSAPSRCLCQQKSWLPQATTAQRTQARAETSQPLSSATSKDRAEPHSFLATPKGIVLMP